MDSIVIRCNSTWWRLASSLLVIQLVTIGAVPVGTPAMSGGQLTQLQPQLPVTAALVSEVPEPVLRAQPLLLALAEEEVSEPVSVIIQKNVQDDSVEQKVISLGGQVLRQLRIINASVVKLPAAAVPELAAFAGVRWISLDAPVLKSASDGSVILRDDLATDLSGLGGWSGQAWQEIGENDGAIGGDVAITQFLGGEMQGLRLQNAGRGIQGFVNLADALTATLNFSYRRKDLDDAGDYVTLEVSRDSGVTWSELGRLTGPATDPGIALASYDVSAYASANFTVRFVTSATFDELDKFYLDFVQIGYTPKNESEMGTPIQANRVFLPLVASTSSSTIEGTNITSEEVNAAEVAAVNLVADYFDTASYSNNQGSQNWASNWTENDSSGTGISSGHVQVVSGALRLDDNPDSGTDPSVARRVDLSNAAGVRLSFSFWTDSGVDANDGAVVEVSKDGGTTYTVLETFTGIAGSLSGRRSYNITRFASSNFMLRFRISANYGGSSEYFYADNVQISSEKIGNGSGTITLIPVGSVWQYLDNGSNQGSGWRSSSFNDSSWKSGQAQLGYGQNDEATVVSYGSDANNKYVTTYFRRTFMVADASTFTGLSISLGYDDGAVIYINGQEVARGNMPVGTISYTTLAPVANAASWSSSYSVASSALVNGENVIAVELHQGSESSSDLSFDLRLDGTTTCVDCIKTSTLANVGLKTIKADSLWNGTTRLQGQGVTVAVLDSGIAPHNDLESALNEERILKRVNFVSSQSSSVDDYNGHGTHIAGTIAGNGARSTGIYPGVAPKANLLDVRVTNDWGVGTTADVVAGLEWVLNNKSTYNIRIVNLSLNSAVAQSYHTSPLDAAVENIWFNGIVVVVSAGNNGVLSNGVVYPPANDPFVITVGAADDRGTAAITDDLIPTFSAYGTTSDGFAKPDLVAPGKDVISVLASDDCNVSLLFSSFRVTSPSGYPYFRMSGTSMSAAVTAGAVALLLQDEPNLTPDQVKYRLMNTANKSWTNYNAAKAGAGYLDIYAAVNGTSTTSANTGIAASQLLWSGSSPAVWGSVNWNSVNWNSVNWNSVNWNSVNWNSTNFSSDDWSE